MLSASLWFGLIGVAVAENSTIYQGRDISKEPKYKPVWEVYAASSSKARRQRAKIANFGAADRTLRPDCGFPMCITILQDATGSFLDDYQTTAEKVLPAMAHVLSHSHPNSTYTLVRFGDKPIATMGETTDICQSLEVLRGESAMDLEFFYKSFLPGGGWDWPENQYGALVATLSSPVTIPYCTNPNAVSLVVMITDSGPHFEGDSAQPSHPELKSWGNDYNETLADDYCLQHYYPSPLTAKEAVLKSNSYFTAIVAQREEDTDTAYESWKWFVTFAGFPESFARLQDDADEGWWTDLDAVISEVEIQECGSTVDPPAPTRESTLQATAPTDATFQPAGSISLLTPRASTQPNSTVQGSVSELLSASASTPPPSRLATPTPSRIATLTPTATAVIAPSSQMTEGASGEDTDNCVCPPENVTCCAKQPEILIALMHRPKELDIHLANDV